MRKIEFAGPWASRPPAKSRVRRSQKTHHPCEKPSSQAQEIKIGQPPTLPSNRDRAFKPHMEISPQLQERTNDLPQELRSELGKDAANQFILIRSAVYYGDNGLPSIDPRVVMGPGSPDADVSWMHDLAQYSDYSPGNVTMSSNHDLDEILDPSLGSTGSVCYESDPPVDDQGSHFEADLALTLCQRCTCEKCKKLWERAKQRRGKRASLETVAGLFHRPDLMNILDAYLSSRN
jgi:hypothetical protein